MNEETLSKVKKDAIDNAKLRFGIAGSVSDIMPAFIDGYDKEGEPLFTVCTPPDNLDMIKNVKAIPRSLSICDTIVTHAHVDSENIVALQSVDSGPMVYRIDGKKQEWEKSSDSSFPGVPPQLSGDYAEGVKTTLPSTVILVYRPPESGDDLSNITLMSNKQRFVYPAIPDDGSEESRVSRIMMLFMMDVLRDE